MRFEVDNSPKNVAKVEAVSNLILTLRRLEIFKKQIDIKVEAPLGMHGHIYQTLEVKEDEKK